VNGRTNGASAAEWAEKSSRRYSSRMMSRARAMKEAGWPAWKIKELLVEEFGHAPSENTIHTWYLARKRSPKQGRRDRERKRTGVPRPVSADCALERMRLLEESGCSHSTIAIVAAVWWGEVLNKHQVRYRLRVEACERGKA
jgi:hypothetical protein